LCHLNGAVPSNGHGHVDAAVDLAQHTAGEEVASALAPDNVLVMVSRLGAAREAQVLVGLLTLTVPRLKPWRHDLFAYLAHRLRPIAARRAPAARLDEAAALVLPNGFVRGRSEAMSRLLDQLQAAARSDLDVLILGETGVGKEYVARIIHDSGPTARGPVVAINCAAIPSELLEAELFGVKARVATGVDARTGLLTRAQGGCVFLDEIGDMPATLQAKLLRALQEPEPIHVRVLSSTNKDLTTMVRGNHFRPDLYYRLRGLEFVLPPLRNRLEDIALLALAFAHRAAESHRKDVAGISRRALDLLEAHDGPGNVRELRSEIERAVLLCPDGGTLSSRYFESLRRPFPKRETESPVEHHSSRAADATSPTGRQAGFNRRDAEGGNHRPHAGRTGRRGRAPRNHGGTHGGRRQPHAGGPASRHHPQRPGAQTQAAWHHQRIPQSRLTGRTEYLPGSGIFRRS